MFNFLKSKKEVLLTDMHEIYGGLVSAGEGRAKYAKSWLEFANYVKIMILTQNSEIESHMDRFVDLFAQIAACHERLSAAEIRNAEDFRDVAERFSVVYRQNDEYIDQKRKFREYEAELKEAILKNETESKKPNYQKYQAKLEANIERLKGLKKEALEETKRRLQVLINTREKYNNFKVRRFTQGWLKYGTALKQESEKEVELLTQVEELLNELKGQLESGTVQKVEAAITEQVGNAPATPYDSTNAAEAPNEEVTTNPTFGSYE
jgi:hypothetical protein